MISQPPLVQVVRSRGLRLLGAAALALLLGIGLRAHPAVYASPCNAISFQVPAFPATSTIRGLLPRSSSGGGTIQEGPVGARIPYTGSLGCGTLPPPGAKITLTVIPTAQQCTGPTGEITVAHPVLSQTLSFRGTFWWPAKASALTSWAMCAYNATNGAFLTSTLGWPLGQYSVIDATAPSISLASASVLPGQTVTITGQNWAPVGQTIKVVLGSCYPCSSILAHVLVTNTATGAFTATLTIPATMAPGTYKIGAYTTTPTPAHFLDTRASGARTLTVA